MLDNNEVKIPIKDLIEKFEKMNNAQYSEYDVYLLRKYFIAVLNFGFINPAELEQFVDALTSSIRGISYYYSSKHVFDYYTINDSVLHINGNLITVNEEIYIINFYKAVTETLFGISCNTCISNTICEIAAEKILNMDINNSKIIKPKQTVEKIGKYTIKLNTGYINYNLFISLLVQMFIRKHINENIVIKELYHKGYEYVFSKRINITENELLIETLESLFALYIMREKTAKELEQEKELIDKYQLILNDMFDSIDETYYAFCALITDESLREDCINKTMNRLKG